MTTPTTPDTDPPDDELPDDALVPAVPATPPPAATPAAGFTYTPVRRRDRSSYYLDGPRTPENAAGRARVRNAEAKIAQQRAELEAQIRANEKKP